MSISAQNMIVLYREDSDESYEFATYYADARGLSYAQLVPVPCSGTEILNSYSEFQTQIENAVKAEIDSEYGSDIRVILVGYGVPGGFRDSNGYTDDIISTTSRLSRINHAFSKGFENPLFSRQKFKRYDDADAEHALIVSRIDAPTLEDAKSIVKNISVVARQGTVNGKLYFDPYAVTDDDEEKAYQNEMVDFETQMLPVLNIKEYKTTFWDSKTDVVIPRLKDDSFMWAWKADRAGYTFFKDKTTARIFLYNADLDGGEKLRDPLDKRWPMLALNAGYAATAGAMSDPLPEGFLRPKAFFDALFRGATIGEAYLFSVPNLDWTMSLFGDPLLTVRFPSAGILLDGYSIRSGFKVMERNVRSTIAYYLEREQELIDLCNALKDTKDVQVMTELLAPFTAVANDTISRTKPDLTRLVSEFTQFPRNGGTFAEYLASGDQQISRLIPLIYPTSTLPNRLIYPQGYWDFETRIVHPTTEFAKYDFQLQLANDEDFTDIIDTGTEFTSLDNLTLNADSSQSKSGWFYEKENNAFTEVLGSITSSYTGRRVRYVPSNTEFFQARQVYWVRYRQMNEFSEMTAWQTFKQVVGT